MDKQTIARIVKAQRLIEQVAQLLGQVAASMLTTPVTPPEEVPPMERAKAANSCAYAVGDVYSPKDNIWISGPYTFLSDAYGFDPNTVLGLDTIRQGNSIFIWKLLPDGNAQTIAFWDEDNGRWNPLLPTTPPSGTVRVG